MTAPVSDSRARGRGLPRSTLPSVIVIPMPSDDSARSRFDSARSGLSPAFALVRRGIVLYAVITLSAGAGFVLLSATDPAEEPSRNPALVVSATILAVAGVVSSFRLAAVPIGSSAGLARSVTIENADHAGTAALRVVGPLLGADAAWSGVLFVAAAVGRSLTRIATGVSDAGELLFILLGVGLWIIAYGAGWCLSGIVVTAVATAVRLGVAHRAGRKISWSWWVVPPILLLAVAAPLLMGAYALLTGASYSGRGLGPLLEFLGDDGRDADGAEGVVLWLGKVAFAALGAGIVALAVDRVRHTRARRGRVDSE